MTIEIRRTSDSHLEIDGRITAQKQREMSRRQLQDLDDAVALLFAAMAPDDRFTDEAGVVATVDERIALVKLDHEFSRLGRNQT